MAYTYSTNDADPTGDERALGEGFLDHLRAAMVTQVRGVSERDARHRLVPSMTPLAGMVRHLGQPDIFREQLDGHVGG